jgi:hypothetical protein
MKLMKDIKITNLIVVLVVVVVVVVIIIIIIIKNIFLFRIGLKKFL